MPTITMADNRDIIIDGVNHGNVIDTIRNDIAKNNGALVADIKAAFDMWFITFHEQKTQAVADAVAAQEAMRLDSEARLAAMQADVDALGTKEEAQAIRKQQEVDALQADIAAKTAKLQTLTQAVAVAEPETIR